MTFRVKPALITLLFILVSCSPRPVVSPSETAQPTQPPAATPTRTATVPFPTLVIPTPTATPVWVNLALPTPQPLTGAAPWLFFPCSDSPSNRVPSIANGDGSGCVPTTLPSDIPADRAWISAAAAHGSFLAFRDTILPPDSAAPDAAYRLQPNGLDDQIWIVKLPENRVIRSIPQIDTDGWARIEQMWQDLSSQNKTTEKTVPLPLSVLLERSAYRWSPDGRFLAYTGVDKIGVDLFVYDSLTDTVRRMTRGRKGAFIWSWSPDGKWIVYHEMAGCRLENDRCQPQQGSNYYAVSFPAPEFQFANSFPADQIDWIARDRYILQDIAAPGQLHTRMVEVNLKFGTVTKLYDQPFYSYTYVPNTYASRAEMYLLNLPEAPDHDRLTGVYLLTPLTGELIPFHTNKFAEYTMQWERTLERFVLSKDATQGDSSQKEVLLAPVQLVDAVPLGVLGSADLFVSPDGFWFTTRLPSGTWGLFTAQGKLVKELGEGLAGQPVPVTWLKKSGGFYFYTSGNNCPAEHGCILFFNRDQDWESTPAGEIQAQPDDLQVIEP